MLRVCFSYQEIKEMAKREVFEQPHIEFDDVHSYLQQLFKGELHSKRVLSLANATHMV